MKPPHDDVWAGLKMDDQLTDRGVELRKKTRDYMSSIKEQLIPYTNKTEFPHFIIDGFKKLGINGYEIKGHGGLGLTVLDSGALVYEVSKGDASCATFFLVHNGIGMSCID